MREISNDFETIMSHLNCIFGLLKTRTLLYARHSSVSRFFYKLFRKSNDK
jgi:hypothetical protein